MLAMFFEKAAGEVFNVGTGTKTTINELAKMMIRASGKRNLRPVHVAARAGDIRDSCADVGKAHRILVYSPTVALRDYI